MRPVRSHPLAVRRQSDAGGGIRAAELGGERILQWNFIGQTGSLHVNLRGGGG